MNSTNKTPATSIRQAPSINPQMKTITPGTLLDSVKSANLKRKTPSLRITKRSNDWGNASDMIETPVPSGPRGKMHLPDPPSFLENSPLHHQVLQKIHQTSSCPPQYLQIPQSLPSQSS